MNNDDDKGVILKSGLRQKLYIVISSSTKAAEGKSTTLMSLSL